jgi:hypothetical protein
MRRRSFTLAVILAATGLALSSTAFASHDFSDVPDSNPFHDDISWMADAGITTGFPDGTFRPGQPVTRQSMAAFMRRLAGQDPDVDPVVDAATLDGMTPAELLEDVDAATLDGMTPAELLEDVDAATLGGLTANQLRQNGGMFEFADVIVAGSTPATATQIGSNLTLLEAGNYIVQFSGMVNTSSDSALLSCVTDGTSAFPGLTDIKVGDATIGYADRFPFSAPHQVISTGATVVAVSCYLEAVVGGGSTVIVDPSISIIQTG